MEVVEQFLSETRDLLERLDPDEINAVLAELRACKERDGTLYLIGNGGGAGHASHAACDFRKIAGMRAWAFDNVSEWTARINDEQWHNAVANWLAANRCEETDLIFVFSVGGGSEEVSENLVTAMQYPTDVVGIVGDNGGYAAEVGTVIRISSTSTPQVEGIQAVLWHLLASAL